MNNLEQYINLEGIEEMAEETITTINKIRDEIVKMKYELREKNKNIFKRITRR